MLKREGGRPQGRQLKVPAIDKNAAPEIMANKNIEHVFLHGWAQG